MDCKNCKELMDIDEQSDEDGMITIIRCCDNCGWSSKSWYDLDECTASNTSWINEKKETIEI